MPKSAGETVKQAEVSKKEKLPEREKQNPSQKIPAHQVGSPTLLLPCSSDEGLKIISLELGTLLDERETGSSTNGAGD